MIMSDTILAYDSGCTMCTDTARSIEDLADGRVQVLPLKSERVHELFKRSGHVAPAQAGATWNYRRLIFALLTLAVGAAIAWINAPAWSLAITATWMLACLLFAAALGVEGSASRSLCTALLAVAIGLASSMVLHGLLAAEHITSDGLAHYGPGVGLLLGCVSQLVAQLRSAGRS